LTKRLGACRVSPLARLLRIEPLEDRRLLAVISVDNLNDSGAGSLRTAIDAANLSIGVPDEITFSVTGTINIASQLPTIIDSLAITGPGANLLTINADNGTDHVPATLDGYRIFSIDNASATLIDVAIRGLTLTGGDTLGQGGGILNRENLTLKASTVSGNASDGGGGIANSGVGTLTVASSTVSGNRAGNAGGIGNFSGGTAVLTSSSVSGNHTAGRGGGVYNRYGGILTITGSTISGNYGGEGGGGVISRLGGGTVTITGSTISGNSALAGGGFYNRTATSTITGSTISGNSVFGYAGAGIFAFGNGTTNIASSIITGNTGGQGSEIFRNVGLGATVNVNAFNLIGDSSKTTAQALGNVTAGATDILATSNGTNPTALAAILAPLANNGGPTQTHALVAGSPAINAGSPVVDLAPSGVATQSSEYPISFPAGYAIDGNPSTFTSTAVEDANATWQVTMPSDSVVTQVILHNRLEAQSRLRDITVEVLDASGVVVAASALLNPENILGGGQVDVGPATLTFDLVAETGGTVVGRTIRVRRTGDPDLSGSGGQGNEGEPNILSLGEVEVLGVAGDPGTDQRGIPFSRIFGGRIDIGAYEAQSLALVVDTLTDESDGDYSAGDLSLREALQLTNANPGPDAIGFDAGLAGGTINIASQLPTITEAVTITGLGANLLTINAGNGTDHLPATLDGFRIFNIDNGNATLIDVVISGLTLTGGDTVGQGGGILNRENFTLTASTVSGNASNSGGGIANFLGTATITDSTVSGNKVSHGGGGIANFGGALVLTGSTVSGNDVLVDATAEGGGILINYGTATITGSTITGNKAAGFGGGGGIKMFGVIATITNSLITGNISVKGSEIANLYGTANLNGFNLIGDNSKTTAQALYGATAGAADILVTSNGASPTALAAIIAPLANNGGPTQTHALVDGSPARDAGNPSFTSPPDFDQRGPGFPRVIGNAVDIGAFERQTPELVGDYNRNDTVDAADYVLWRKTVGATGAPFFGADGNGNGDVGQADHGVWRTHFAESLPGAGAGASNATSQELTAATSVPSEVAMLMPTTPTEGSDTATSIATPTVGSDFVWLANAEGSPRVRAWQVAITTLAGAEAFAHDNGLLAWLSLPRLREVPLAGEVSSSLHSNEEVTQVDGSELSSVDEIFAGLASALVMDV
jgi:hypothetical protein